MLASLVVRAALAVVTTSVAAQQFITFPGWAHDDTPDGSVVGGNGMGGGYSWRGQVDPAPVVIGGSLAVAVSDDGAVIAGSNGTPVLADEGTLVAGTPSGISLSQGRVNGSAALVVGMSTLMAPFKQGVLVPFPDAIYAGLPLDGAGKLQLASTLPAGIPSATSIWWQCWISDPAAPAGVSASNGLRSTTP